MVKRHLCVPRVHVHMNIHDDLGAHQTSFHAVYLLLIGCAMPWLASGNVVVFPTFHKARKAKLTGVSLKIGRFARFL